MDIKKLLLEEDDEWSSLNQISHIINNIYLSGMIPLSTNLEENIKKNNIKVIISMTENKVITLEKYCFMNKDMEYYHFSSDDIISFNISKYFDPTFQIIYRAIANNKNILVHCMQGVSRSATIVIAFLMRFLKYKFLKTPCLNKKQYDILNTILTRVKKRRKIVNPNNGFINQLMILEDSFKR